MTNTCHEVRELLGAHADAELPPHTAAAVAEHLTSCEACSAEFASLLQTVSDMRQRLARYPAPDVLRARVRAALAAEIPATAERETGPVPGLRMLRRTSSRWRQLAAASIIAVASGGVTYTLARRPVAEDMTVAREIEASHVRSLLTAHLFDVSSSDQHTVKPWFTGKLDFSPPVPRLESQGFPLVGGRLEYVAGHRAAAIVYQRRRHVINLYVWPAQRAGEERPTEETVRGFHALRWRQDGLEVWAVSDVSLPDLRRFAELVRASASDGRTTDGLPPGDSTRP